MTRMGVVSSCPEDLGAHDHEGHQRWAYPLHEWIALKSGDQGFLAVLCCARSWASAQQADEAMRSPLGNHPPLPKQHGARVAHDSHGWCFVNTSGFFFFLMSWAGVDNASIILLNASFQ